MSLITLMYIVHFIGMSLAAGAASVKLALVIKCRKDTTFIPSYLKVAAILTRQIVAGMILVTLSGLVWLVIAYDFTALLILKIILVGAIWILGPYIDKVVEPKFRRLAPAVGDAATSDFIRVQNQYLVVELSATLLFYIIIVLWMLR